MEDPFPTSNGGVWPSDPDGYLYVSTGDGGGDGDPLGSDLSGGHSSARSYASTSTSRGMLEYALWHPARRSIRRSKPGARPEIWHAGLRNCPFRNRFDAATGDLLDRRLARTPRRRSTWHPAASAASTRWTCSRAPTASRTEPCDRHAGLAAPVVEYSHDEGCVVTRSRRYRRRLTRSWWAGTSSPTLLGRVSAVDSAAARVAATEGRCSVRPSCSTRGAAQRHRPGPAGELYATDLDRGELLLVTVPVDGWSTRLLWRQLSPVVWPLDPMRWY